MKKMLWIGIFGMILTACNDQDMTYFFDHQDRAQEILKSCEKRLEKALVNSDQKGIESLLADEECQAAEAAIKAQRRIDYEKEQAERARLKRLEEEKRLQAVHDAKAIIRQKYLNHNWQQNISEYFKVECRTGFIQPPSIECSAWEIYYQEAIAEGERELAKLSFESLKGLKREYCHLDQRRGSACEVWERVRNEKGHQLLKDLDIFVIEEKRGDYCSDQSPLSSLCQTWKNAWRVKSDELVTKFVNNDDLFLESYNYCFNKIEKIQERHLSLHEKAQEERAIKSMSPCIQAATAYQRRGIGYNPYQLPISL